MDGEIAPNRWGKVGKVILFLVLFLLAGAGIGFGVYFRVTNIGETLQHAPEITRKTKEYGMYSTHLEFENGIRNMPKGHGMSAELQSAVSQFEKASKDLKSNYSLYMDFRIKTKRPILESEVRTFRSAIEKSKTILEKLVSRADPPLVNTWEMNDFFQDYETRPIELIDKVQSAMLIDAWQEAADGNFAKAIARIRFEAKVRRYIATNNRTVEGGIYAIKTWKTTALIYLRILQHLKSPPSNLVHEMLLGLNTPIPFTYQHYARECFYIGGDWFPKGKTMSALAEDEGRFLRLHPSIVKAWKLHIQLAAIHAYESGAKQSSEIEALDAAMQTFSEEIYDGAAYDTSRWAIPDGNLGGAYLSEPFHEAPKKLQVFIKTLDKLR